LLVDDVGMVLDEYEGLAADEERVMPIANALREKRAVFLPNHGAITTGDNIQVAFLRMVLLEDMAVRNLAVAQAAQSLGLKPVPISPEAARRAKAEIARIPVLQHLWKDFLTRLRATDPDLFQS
jgi:ribulose-5-phosphate 4-epimerase/fuculose-1-phosphate aldolase